MITKITKSPEFQASICIGFLFSITVLSLGLYYNSLRTLAGSPKNPNPYPVIALFSLAIVTLIVYIISGWYKIKQKKKAELNTKKSTTVEYNSGDCFKYVPILSVLVIILLNFTNQITSFFIDFLNNSNASDTQIVTILLLIVAIWTGFRYWLMNYPIIRENKTLIAIILIVSIVLIIFFLTHNYAFSIVINYIHTQFTDIFIPLISAFAGAGAAALMYHVLEKKRKREQKTADFIDEFFSNDFTMHRASLYKTHKNATYGNNITYEDTILMEIARGFLYHVVGEYYEGNTQIDNLSEHQHMVIYFGYLKRLYFSIKKGQVNEDEIRNALSYGMRWHAELVLSICKKIEYLTKNESSYKIGNDTFCYRPPSFVDEIEKLHKELEIDNGSIHKKCPQK
ncbi:hypothetical protein [Methanolobus vulcani]|uniref:Uncharacterized protein n=1 Tax=Methanolobus vulcani TaxID=38026 RepID=A0A7Z8P0C5_9EURY|nr:hypothetical protein [Methanolobus vulcani]TQD23545.1 hypothetical protein FKV42_13560 [Methanolobus vulcani]